MPGRKFSEVTVRSELLGNLLFVTIAGDCTEDDIVAEARRALLQAPPGAIRFLALEHDGGNLGFSPRGLRRLAQLPTQSPGLNSSWLLVLADEWHGELARLMYVYGSVWADAPRVFGNRNLALRWAAAQPTATTTTPAPAPGQQATGPG